MKTRTDLLNYLAERFKLTTYCEIGLQNRAANYNKIVCPIKTGIDPDPASAPDFCGTSDEFFKRVKGTMWSADLFWIDGLHHAEQVKKDFENALNCLNPGGFICLHDCLPVEEIHAKVPRESKVWNGDVYRFIFTLNWYQNLHFRVVDIDHGCCVVWKSFKEKEFSAVLNMEAIGWKFYLENRSALNIITPEQLETTDI